MGKVIRNKASITYKKLKPKDLANFRKLNEVFADAFEDQETHLVHKPSDRYLSELLGKNHFIAISAMSADKVVGGLVAYVLEKYDQERSEIYIYDLAVDENFRRQGIARNLIKELKTIAKEIGAYVIFVQADPEDTPAIKLYQSMGIQEAPFHFDISIEK